MSIIRGAALSRCARTALAMALLLPVHVHASVFVGDLVYCDVNADGSFNDHDYPLDDVAVTIECLQDGDVCFQETTLTGTLHQSAIDKISVFADACGETATFDPLEAAQLTGRYLFEITGNFNAMSGCFFGGGLPPYTCRVGVDPTTLPGGCDLLVTPRAAAFPFDGNDDGDRCDVDDGPFPEDQVLGNIPSQGGCEDFPDPPPADGVYAVSIQDTYPFPAPDRCSIGNDFGYTLDGDGCTPGFWRNHRDAWGDTGFSPYDDFDTTFGVDYFDPDISLGQAVWAKGGGLNKVARHGTAALLNASDPDVDYPVDIGDVIAAVQAGNVDHLVAPNELSDACPALSD